MESRLSLRSIRASVFWIFCGIALLIIIIPAVDIIISVLKAAIPVIKPEMFTKTEAQGGGLQNAILGTLYLGIGVLISAGTLGVLGGLYIAEFAPTRLASVLRFFSEVLSGVPSIVVGYVGYISLVVTLHWKYSLLGGILALGALILPYIVKTTELSFSSVPRTLREGAVALGLSKTMTIRRVLLPPALPGIISGLVIAIAISTGETAPLLFTAGYSTSDPTSALIGSPVGYLTGLTYNDLQLPGGNYQALANAAAGLTIVLILILIFGGRLITARARRSVARMDL